MINMINYDIEDSIMVLHHIARIVEREIGFGSPISQDIRGVADRLHNVATATFDDVLTLNTDEESDNVVFTCTPTNTPENVMKVLKS